MGMCPCSANNGKLHMTDLAGRTIVFDLDGTLIDTAPDLIEAVNHVIGTFGHQPLEPQRLRPAISFGGRHMIETALSHYGQDAATAEVDQLFLRFIAHYSENIAVHSRPFPGLKDQLDALAARGATLAVCTNKREDLARQVLSELGLLDKFATLTGRDTFPVHKPHPAHLLRTIEKAGGNPASGVMIGDSATDVKTAKAAELPVIGVTFGYTDVSVREMACDAVIEHYDELPAALSKVMT